MVTAVIVVGVVDLVIWIPLRLSHEELNTREKMVEYIFTTTLPGWIMLCLHWLTNESCAGRMGNQMLLPSFILRFSALHLERLTTFPCSSIGLAQLFDWVADISLDVDGTWFVHYPFRRMFRSTSSLSSSGSPIGAWCGCMRNVCIKRLSEHAGIVNRHGELSSHYLVHFHYCWYFFLLYRALSLHGLRGMRRRWSLFPSNTVLCSISIRAYAHYTGTAHHRQVLFFPTFCVIVLERME